MFFSSASTVLRCRMQANFLQRTQMPPVPTGPAALQTQQRRCIDADTLLIMGAP
jgi:hypothetical protein